MNLTKFFDKNLKKPKLKSQPFDTYFLPGLMSCTFKIRLYERKNSFFSVENTLTQKKLPECSQDAQNVLTTLMEAKKFEV